MKKNYENFYLPNQAIDDSSNIDQQIMTRTDQSRFKPMCTYYLVYCTILVLPIKSLYLKLIIQFFFYHTHLLIILSKEVAANILIDYIKQYEADRSKLEMCFDCTNYQYAQIDVL